MILSRRAAIAGLSLLPGLARGQPAAASATPNGSRVLSTARGDVSVHTVLAPERGVFVTSHIIEGPSGLVLVDGQFDPVSARDLKGVLDALGKPLRAVLLSHFHPDHWAGFHQLGRPEVLTGPVTADLIRQVGESIVARERDTSVPRIAGTVAPGTLRLAGVELTIAYAMDTEAPEMMIVDVPAASAVIVQDVVYNRVHAYVSRQLDAWIAALRGLEGRRDVTILAGHGEPATVADLPRFVAYLEAVKPLVAGAAAPDVGAIVAEMGRRFPEFRFPPLLELSLTRIPPG